MSDLGHPRCLEIAIRQVSDEISAEEQSVDPNVVPSEDQLGWTMEFLRAAEACHLGAMKQALAAYVSHT